jgi:hypothetical protein
MVDPILARFALTAMQRAGAAMHRRFRLAHGVVGARKFAKLVDKLARDAEKLRRTEFRSLPEHDWRAAAECLKAAFELVGEVDARISLRFAMNPERLAVWLLDLDPDLPRRHGLSPPACDAMGRLAVLACAAVMSHVADHPEFAERMQEEQLRGISELKGLVAPPSDDELAAFEARYRVAVSRRLDRLELFGVTLRAPDFQYPMSSAYVSMSAHGRGRILPDDDRPPRIEDLLGDTRRVLLTGEAGSGKTTFLRRMAVWAARDGFPSTLRAWRGTVPFYLTLRHFLFDRTGPQPEQFLDQVGMMLRGEQPQGWIRGVMRDGRALLLIDGVDELTAAERRVFWHEWLREVIDEYPGVRLIVASRPAAVNEQGFPRDELPEATLQPMTLAEQRVFVANWYLAVAATRPPGYQDAAPGDQHDLVNRLVGHRHLRRLASNPLLCALLCALHHERRMHLPEDRIRLYEAALEMLLVRRDDARGVPAGHEVLLGEGEQESVLRKLAYWMIRNGYREVSFEEAVERIEDYLRATTSPSRAEDVLRHLVARSGILRHPAAGRVDFVHDTFQEFLAAKQALEEGDLGQLARRADEDERWRAVFVMAVGLAREHERGELVRDVIRRATAEPDVRNELVLLAADAVANSPAIAPSVRDEVTTHTSRLMPPPSFEEAVRLAGIGEPVLDVLPSWHDAHAAGRGQYLIRLVAEIGGEAALAILAGYAAACTRPLTPHVARAFYAAWDYFDDVQYAQAVLAHVPPATAVAIGSKHRLDAAVLLPSVPWAVVDGRPELLGSVAGIVGLTGLVVLTPDDATPDLTPVTRCPALACVHVVAPGHAVRWRLGARPDVVATPLAGVHFDVVALHTDTHASAPTADVDVSSCRGVVPVTFHGFPDGTLPSIPTRE